MFQCKEYDGTYIITVNDKSALGNPVLWEVPFQWVCEQEMQAAIEEGSSPSNKDQNEGQKQSKYREKGKV